MRKAEKIQTVLERVIGRLGIARRVRESDVVRRFADIVGDPIAQRAQAVGIENGRLLIRVESPTWRQELNYRKQEIAGILNEALGERVVRDVYFVS
jgi:predicted nucleic acid-binding Zn ribbon protein